MPTISDDDHEQIQARIASYVQRLADIAFSDVVGFAYNLGYEAGSNAVRTQIVAALQGGSQLEASLVSTSPKLADVPAQESGARKPRAAKGAVREAIFAVLQKQPGLSISEIGRQAVTLGYDISRHSIHGELSKKRHLYRQEASQWFLVAAQVGSASDQADHQEPERLTHSRSGLFGPKQEEATDDTDTTIAA